MGPDFGRLVDRKLRVLDFDIENRPLAYWYDDKTTSEVTAIAWSWDDYDGISGYGYLEPPPFERSSFINMLGRFREAYDYADMVTGHYIRKHDLPILNAAMIEAGFPPLGPKLTSDTKLDLIRYGGQSASQMALANALDVKKEKPRMSVSKWRDANRLTPDGIDATIERVTGDVRQHKELRLALIDHGLLKSPRMWRP